MNKVNYDNFAQKFSVSRDNMIWEEIEYFEKKYFEFIKGKKILDIGCGNGRLLNHFIKNNLITNINYFGIDSSIGMIKEAENKFGISNFFLLNMLEIDQIKQNFESIFFIASFHHLLNIEERLEVLEKLKSIILSGSYIFFTFWSLNSELNKQKYEKNIILNSKNIFQSEDYNIKFGKFDRFYHNFSLEELEYLFIKTGYKIIENRLFENQKNIISVIKNN